MHRRNLVYNACWEDPRIDREALRFTGDDDVLVITSAGCNALDYLLAGAGSLTCVDLNPIQNALLSLKVAALRRMEYRQFFRMFGLGSLPGAERLYRRTLRPELPGFARDYWDKHIDFFDSERSFYFRGSAGLFARLIGCYIGLRGRLRAAIDRLVAEPSEELRREIYLREVEPRLWSKPLALALTRSFTFALLGVPPLQRRHLERNFGGSIIAFIKSVLERVFVQLPFADNYFWKVYLDGCYSETCCPEYLMERNVERLRKRVADLSIHDCSVADYLSSNGRTFSVFALLDHLDWMEEAGISEEWGWIVRRARPKARFLWRSASPSADFFFHLPAGTRGEAAIGQLIDIQGQRAARLHRLDRVHTYASLGVAELRAAA